MHLRQLIESPDTAVFAFGRMNPPTIGHKKLADTVKGIDGTPFLFLTHSQKPKTDPLSFAEKVFFAQQSFGDGIRIGDKDVRTIIQAMQKLESIGFKNIIYVAGSDRVNSFTKLLNDYNGKDYKFDSIKVVSAGERDPDAEGAEGMSASKMRSAAQEGNFDEFESGVAVQNPKLAKMMYTKVRQGMGLAESEQIDEGLGLLAKLGFKYGGKTLKFIGRFMRRNPKTSVGVATLPWTGPYLAMATKLLAGIGTFLSAYGIPLAVGVIAIYGGKKLYDALKDKDPDTMSEEELNAILKAHTPRSDNDLEPIAKAQPQENVNEIAFAPALPYIAPIALPVISFLVKEGGKKLLRAFGSAAITKSTTDGIDINKELESIAPGVSPDTVISTKQYDDAILRIARNPQPPVKYPDADDQWKKDPNLAELIAKLIEIIGANLLKVLIYAGLTVAAIYAISKTIKYFKKKYDDNKLKQAIEEELYGTVKTGKKESLTAEDLELAELIRKKELVVQQQKPKIDVLNNIAMRSDGKPFPLSWNAGKGEISVGGKVYVGPKAAKQFVSFFDRNEDKQEAMLKALQSASTTAKLFDVLGLKYKLDMER
jgi:hypothetical protein